MTLRRKTQVTLGILMLLLLLVLDWTFTSFLRQSAEQSDKERILQNLSRVSVSVNAEAQTLAAIAGNWAYSDSTWNYMRTMNSDYVLKVLNRDVLTDIGISSLIFVDNQRDVVLFKDYSRPDEPSAPQDEYTAIFSNPDNNELFNNENKDGTSGIVLQGDEALLFSVKPILKSNKQGPQAGYLLATKKLSPTLINSISRNMGFSFAIEPITEAESKSESLPVTVIRKIQPKDTSISAKMLVRDHRGAPAFWVMGILPKQDITETERKMQILFLMIAAGAIFLCFVFDIFFKRTFTNRMKRLQNEVEAIRDESPNNKQSITTDNRRDEISSLQRVLYDSYAYNDYKTEKMQNLDRISIMVYERFAQAGNRLCYKTLEDIASAITPGDEKYRASIVRAAKKTWHFCRSLGMKEEELLYSYLGALFSRIGLLGLPTEIRDKNTPLTPHELREYQKYPIISKDIMENVELLRPAYQIPLSWNENWDGTGFPHASTGSSINISARIFAIVNEWNEMTRPWMGRKLPTEQEVEDKLRSMEGTRLDPQLTEKFISILKENSQHKD